MSIECTVFKGTSGNYFVRELGGTETYCVKLRGTLKKDLEYSTSLSHARRVTRARKRRATDPVSVGDTVIIDPKTLQIEEVLPRRSEFARTTPGGHEQHVLVANLDTVFVTVAAANPYPNFWLLDRFLVAAESAELNAQIIINKVDLAEDIAATRKEAAVYERIGYPVHFTAARSGQGVDELMAALKGKISAFAGPSGVGKSSLLNAIEPGLRLKTGEVSEVTHLGRHTTTTAELIPLKYDVDTWVADTPGLRQVEFWEIESQNIEFCFPEFKEFFGQCQFSNCTHQTEPGCAIREASRTGQIDKRRYDSFIQMMTPEPAF
ncbi:MAG TPA: ribosome small subunit-dependent GTPase A [Capsulimonadaceae bacterium]|jgi:ribosome biogenesis GTPase